MLHKAIAKTAFVLLAPFLALNTAQAHWSLANDASTLSFVTTKADNVAEVHTFDTLSGSIAPNGTVEVSIELASVNTLIPIRNERMQAMLFETPLFPNATIAANVDFAAIDAMAPGETAMQQLSFTLDLHGSSASYTADVQVTRLQGGVVASTLKPVIVTADAFGLVAGVEALREVAGLTRISNAVPVSFSVTFVEGE